MTPAPEPRHGRSGWRATGRVILELSRAATGLVRENPVLPAVAGIGFALSFQTIAGLARQQHMSSAPVLYPLLIDVGILAATIESRRAIDKGRSDLAPRVLTWALCALTIYVNAHGSPGGDWLGLSLHVAAPVLWIAFLELTRWRKLASTDSRRDRIPLARWLNYPVSSFAMFRHMVQHNITSYQLACAREEALALARDLARVVYDGPWRKAAPLLLRQQLRHGSLPLAVAAACADGGDVTGAVDEWVRTGRRQRAATAALARQDERATTETADAPSQRAKVRPRRARSSAAVPAARRVAAERIADSNPGIRRADLMAQVPGLTPRTADRILSARRPRLTVAR